MDYEQLLRKYLEHVRQSEGINYLDRLNVEYGSDVEFTGEEVATLERLAAEAEAAAEHD
ncbi:hypothetical protein [Pseudomonas tohonis]|uniref:hypothetical protein n=1 Tax=Pseudomonas tohonis TaxID=2725477 RepID=UPI001F30EB00|nr:hypothetical protein [Pseudomonas tohonis]